MTPLIEALLTRVPQEVAARRRLPESTYRLQFHAGFTFRDAAALVPYLRDLGITHCYASPYLKARPGSLHGYVITNHQALNPEIGTEEDYAAFTAALREHGLGQILDTVPNHMGIVGNENAWWNDVLEHGPSSPYANYFDIAWFASPRPALHGRVLLPILGDPYGKVLESGQLQLACNGGGFVVNYFDHRFPLTPRSYDRILGHRLAELRERLGAESPDVLEYESILTAIRHLPEHTETAPERIAERAREKEVIKRRLAALADRVPAVRAFIAENLAEFNGRPGEPRSFDRLDELLNDQPYRLAYWRVAADEINYRRFFDINELAALSAEREEVFRETHALVFRLLREGRLDGLRIDHPDGLYDPKQYFDRLQLFFLLECARSAYEADPALQQAPWEALERPLLDALARARQDDPAQFGRPLYVVAEKILGATEPLPEDWPIEGTSGYAFLNMLNGLFVDNTQAREFTRLYRDWAGIEESFGEIVYQKKFLIMQVALSSELHMLAHQLDRLAQKNRWSRDFTLNSLRHALREVIACFPVYRSYISDAGVSATDQRYVERAVRLAARRNPAISTSIFAFVRDMLLLRYPDGATEEDKAEQRRFAGKFQQVTAPVMAKGLEDTAFYVYNRLLSLNEVGGDAGRFGITPDVLHRYLQERQARWPRALSALSTHDTKRSEDVRARLNVLSELPHEWEEHLKRWGELNAPHRLTVDDETVPDANEEYLFYQTLLGAWPLEPYSADEYRTFIARVQAYMQKATREAKVHTSWINPNPPYDEAIQQFVARVLDPEANRPFLDAFRPFQRRLSHYGLLNSLAQTLVKITAPGVPDTYQGTELWDFSLVDPDNRRPVDYDRRRHLLAELRTRLSDGRTDRVALARELLDAKEDGRIKLYVTSQALGCRRDNPGLFASGEYLPAAVVGAKQSHAFGFARRQDRRSAVVVIPLLLTRLLLGEGQLPLGPGVWQDTQLLLPAGLASSYRNVFTGETLRPAPAPRRARTS